MSDVCQLVGGPAIIRAIFTGLARPQGQKFKVTAKGGDRSRGFVEWTLIRFYGSLLALNIIAIAFAFFWVVRGNSIGYGTLALMWSWYNILVLAIICFVSIEQPRRRRTERFVTSEAMLVTAAGEPRSIRLADISISGASFRGPAPAALGDTIQCRIGKKDVGARIVRVRENGFAVDFEDTLGGARRADPLLLRGRLRAPDREHRGRRCRANDLQADDAVARSRGARHIPRAGTLARNSATSFAYHLALPVVPCPVVSGLGGIRSSFAFLMRLSAASVTPVSGGLRSSSAALISEQRAP